MKPNIFWIAAILWIATIFYFSTRPVDISRKQSGEILVKADIIKESEVNTSVPKTTRESYVVKMQNQIRKSAHAIEYFILGIFVTMALTFKQKMRIFNIIIAVIICLGVASLDEFIQRYIPGRGPMISDVKLDIKGAYAGLALILMIRLAIIGISRIKSNAKMSVGG